MSEKLFMDIWEKYGCPEEVSVPLTIYNILNDIIVKSKHWIVLDHYSHINFDEVKKVEYDEMNITVRQSRQSGVARATCPD